MGIWCIAVKARLSWGLLPMTDIQLYLDFLSFPLSFLHSILRLFSFSSNFCFFSLFSSFLFFLSFCLSFFSDYLLDRLWRHGYSRHVDGVETRPKGVSPAPSFYDAEATECKGVGLPGHPNPHNLSDSFSTPTDKS